MRRTSILGALVVTVASLQAGNAGAWGDEGHELIALIAYDLLTPTAKASVDALLADDHDPLTAPDFASRATWADKYRDASGRKLHYKQTREWHFVDIEISAPDIDAACFNHPALAQGTPASHGPPRDCVVDKIREFESELANPSTPKPERLMALKFIMHFVGDVHQPLHASDDNDQGGNCEQVRLTPRGRKFALHHFWDANVVEGVIRADQAQNPGDDSLPKVADRMAAEIGQPPAGPWDPAAVDQWALDSFHLAQRVGYDLPNHAACTGQKPSEYPAFVLPQDYQDRAVQAARDQIKLAGARLAYVLNTALS